MTPDGCILFSADQITWFNNTVHLVPILNRRLADMEAQNTELRRLAQQTADQECLYLREITDLRRRLAKRQKKGKL